MRSRWDKSDIRHLPDVAATVPSYAREVAGADDRGMTSGLVTVVFVDVEGSTALIDRLGDEAGTAAVQRQLAEVRERITPYGGTEVKALGDGVMLTFASPRNAVAFALAAQRAVGRTTPRIRAGINTGEVLDADGDPLGGAVNAAARIADKAKGGEVLVSEVVRQLVGSTPGVDFVDRGRFKLKGFPDRSRLYAAVDPSTEVVSETTVGRTDELAVVDAVVSSAATGVGQVLLLEGEAGIGKSHLVRAAVDVAKARGMRIVSADADELDARPGGLVRGLLDTIPPGVADRNRLAELLTMPSDPAEGVDLGYAATEALVDVIETMATSSPVLVVVEDLHWADDLSLRAVVALARRTQASPIVVIASCRPTPRPALLDRFVEWIAAPHGRHLLLDPLDDVTVCALASAHTGAAPGAALLDRLGSAAGNPLYVTELLRAFEDEGVLRVDGGVVDVDAAALPAGLRQTIVRRLSTLPAESVEFLRLASILGGSFTLRDLAAVSGRTVVDVAAGLRVAAQAAIIAGDGDRLSFRHDLIREAVYEDIDPAVRRDLHRAAGQSLAAADAPVTQVAHQLAMGARAGDIDAVEWLERAAHEARFYNPATAIDLVERALEIAPDSWPRRVQLEAPVIELLSSCGRLSDGEQLAKRLLSRPLDPNTEFIARRGLASVYGNQGHWVQSIEALEAAANVPGAPREDALILRCLVHELSILTGVGDRDAHIESARAMLAEASTIGNDTLLCLAHQALAIGAGLDGYDDAALEHGALAAGFVRAGRVGWHSYLNTEAFLAIGLLMLDRIDEALEIGAAARRRAEHAGATTAFALPQLVIGVTFYVTGAWDDAASSIEECVALTEETGNRGFVLFTYSVLADIALHRGDEVMAEAILDAANERMAMGGSLAGFDWVLCSRAELLERRGQVAEAVGLAETVWSHMGRLRYLFGGRWRAVTMVRLAARTGRSDFAHEVASAMEEWARRTSAPSVPVLAAHCRGLADRDSATLLRSAKGYAATPLVALRARCYEDAADVLLAEGKRDDAVAALDDAIAIYAELGADGDLNRINETLRAAGIRRRRTHARRPTTGWESLTPMERQVADLVAEGLTNPAIGERLYVSRRTVETHLSHIFTKCGLNSRAQVAAEIARQKVTSS